MRPGLASRDRHFTTIVHTADIVVRALRYGNGGDNRIPCRDARIRSEDFDAILREAHAEIENSEVFLEFL